jgi:ubiquinone/menaquinone biosynthesis C-methylase UbiE
MIDATAAAEDRHFWFAGLRRNAKTLLDRALDGRRPSLIVDCGSGTGRNLDWLSAVGPAVGIDRSPAGLAHGRRSGRRMIRGSVTSLPLRDASADVMTSFDVLYSLDDEDERRALAEMWRVLRPGGVAIINSAALDLLRGSHSALTLEKRRHSRRRLARALEAAGFQIERLTYTNMVTLPVVLGMRLAERLRGRDREPTETALRVPAVPINVMFDLALRAEHVWLRVAGLPIGSSLLAVARKPDG